MNGKIDLIVFLFQKLGYMIDKYLKYLRFKDLIKSTTKPDSVKHFMVLGCSLRHIVYDCSHMTKYGGVQ